VRTSHMSMLVLPNIQSSDTAASESGMGSVGGTEWNDVTRADAFQIRSRASVDFPQFSALTLTR
jgi:hypothetical protein